MKPTTAILMTMALASVACACNIPVFRYALERWRPDRCELIVFHDGPLAAEHGLALEKLESKYGNRDSSVKIVRADISDSTVEYRELWTAVESDFASSDAALSDSEKPLPYAVVRTTLAPGRVVIAWHGPLGAIADEHVLQSPARQELSRRLLSGDAIVWLMIASSDEARNEQARRMLSDNFQTLARKIELPEGIGLPGSELHSEIPLLLRFSLLEIDRGNPDETFLVRLLSGFQPQAVAEGEPLIIPVFGRGRALEVIPAGDLSERLMEDLTAFLSGPCSCQVKEQNPGFDLLLSVDWNTALFGEGVEPPKEKTTRDRDQPILLTIPPGR